MYGQRTAVGRLDLPRMLGDTTLALDGVRVRSPTRNSKPETRNSKPARRGSRRGRVPAWSPGAGTCGARGRTRHLARPYQRHIPVPERPRWRESRLPTRNPKPETRNSTVGAADEGGCPHGHRVPGHEALAGALVTSHAPTGDASPYRRGRDGVRVGSRLETRNPKLETRNPKLPLVRQHFSPVSASAAPGGSWGSLNQSAPGRRLTTVLQTDERHPSDLISRLSPSHIVDCVPDAIAIVDQDGQIVYLNEAWLKLTGTSPRAAAIELSNRAERRASNPVRPDGTPVSPGEFAIDRALAGEVVRESEIILTDADGSKVWLSTNANPIQDEDGTIIGAIASSHDVTRMRRLEIEHEWARDQAQR